MIKMKALRSFGVMSANEGKVQRGREFVVANEQRARDLEEAGLAYRLEARVITPDDPSNRMIDSTSNEAAVAGPLGSVGGTTGADVPVPSSLPGHQQQKRRGRPPLHQSKDESRS